MRAPRASSEILDAVADAYIAKRLYWHGRITRQDVMDALNVASSKATNLLAGFRARHPGELREAGKGYAPDATFSHPAIAGDFFLDDLLDALRKEKNPALVAGERPPARIPHAFRRQVKTDVLKAALLALAEYRALVIVYVGMREGAAAETRTVEPVELVYVNERWHMRAFCYRAEDFRHFVLSRILRVEGSESARYKWLETNNYHDPVKTIRLRPHPSLTEDQRMVVEFEYRMENGVLKIALSEDDLFYFKEHYVAKPGEGPPQKVLVMDENTSTD